MLKFVSVFLLTLFAANSWPLRGQSPPAPVNAKAILYFEKEVIRIMIRTSDTAEDDHG